MTPQELMTDYLAAARRGDWDMAFGFFAADIVMHVPGRSAFAGDREGKDAPSDTSSPSATTTGTARSSSN